MIHIFNKTHSKISTIMAAFNAGSRIEGRKYNAGISHMLEHSIFKGTKKRTSSQIMEVLGRLRSIIDNFTTSIILVHHTGKNESRGGRGSNAIEGEYDSSIYIKRERGKSQTKLLFDLRHEESPKPRDIHFNSETNWFETNSLKTSLKTTIYSA